MPNCWQILGYIQTVTIYVFSYFPYTNISTFCFFLNTLLPQPWLAFFSLMWGEVGLGLTVCFFHHIFLYTCQEVPLHNQRSFHHSQTWLKSHPYILEILSSGWTFHFLIFFYLFAHFHWNVGPPSIGDTFVRGRNMLSFLVQSDWLHCEMIPVLTFEILWTAFWCPCTVSCLAECLPFWQLPLSPFLTILGVQGDHGCTAGRGHHVQCECLEHGWPLMSTLLQSWSPPLPGMMRLTNKGDWWYSSSTCRLCCSLFPWTVQGASFSQLKHSKSMWNMY